MSPTVAAAVRVLEDCRAFLSGLTPEAYAASYASSAGSSLGAHVRHSLDHFEAALAALSGHVIEYDRRERGTAVERELTSAVERVESLVRRLQAVAEGDLSWPVRVRLMLDGAGTEAVLGSTLARELAFATHHAIHHHAMLAAIARDAGLSAASSFGKAPSTVQHERQADTEVEAGAVITVPMGERVLDRVSDRVSDLVSDHGGPRPVGGRAA